MAMHQKAAVQAVTAQAAEIGKMYVNTMKATFNRQQKRNNKLQQKSNINYGKCDRHRRKYQNITIGNNQAAATDSER